LEKDETAAVLVTIDNSTDVVVSFYGTEPIKFELDDQFLPYL